MAQGDFTKQAEETFMNSIDELNSAEDAIEYLNDKRNGILYWNRKLF